MFFPLQHEKLSAPADIVYGLTKKTKLSAPADIVYEDDSVRF